MFYNFSYSYKRGAIWVQARTPYDSLSMLPLDTILKENNTFYVARDKKWYDILPFNDSPALFAMSERVKCLLEDNHVTGWSCFPIVIENSNVTYYAFQVLLTAGEILNLQAVNDHITEHIEFDITTWDGSEVFTLQGTGLHVCTERVKLLLEKAKVTNLEFEPL